MNNRGPGIRTRLTLAEAVLLLAAGRTGSPALKRAQEHGALHRPPPPRREDWWEAKAWPSQLPDDLAKEVLRRLHRRRGGTFPPSVLAARDRALALIEAGTVNAWGTPCDADGNVIGPEERLHLNRLGSGAVVSLIGQIELQADWMAPGGFGREAGYRAVQLDRRQLLAWARPKTGTPGARHRALAALRADPPLQEDAADDPFEASSWSRLQVELWVCTRSGEAVRWAAHEPGRTRLLDLDEGEPRNFEDEAELVGAAIINFGPVRKLDDARRDVVAAQAEGRLRAYRDPQSRKEFFKREDVLALWRDEPTGAGTAGKGRPKPPKGGADASAPAPTTAPQAATDSIPFGGEQRAIFTLLEALHWLAFGDANAPGNDGALASWDQAERDLVAALRRPPGAEKRVVAVGFKHGRSDAQEIPSEFWTIPTKGEKETMRPPPARYFEFAPVASAVDVVRGGRSDRVWEQLQFRAYDLVSLRSRPLERPLASEPEAAAGVPEADTSLPASEINKQNTPAVPKAVMTNVPEPDLRQWLRRNDNVKVAEKTGRHRAQDELGGKIPRSRYRKVRREVAAELEVELAPGRRPNCAENRAEK